MNDKNFKVKKSGGVKTKKTGGRGKGTTVKKKSTRSASVKKKAGGERINPYYWKLAQGVSAVKYILSVGLVLMCLGGFIVNSNEFSLDNIRYLLRYVDIQTSKKVTVSDFPVESDEYSHVSFYRNNIAVVSPDRISIYDLTGRRNFTAPCIYSEPNVSVSDKYILSYDIGSYKMEVYNSFSKLYEYKGENPIMMAKINSSGNIAYLTSQLGSHSALHITNRDFSSDFFVLTSDYYVTSFDISDNADRLIVGAFTSLNGDYLTRISVYNTAEKEPRTKLEYAGVMPYYIKCHPDGFFAVFKNEIKFFGKDDAEINSYSFNDGIFQKIVFTDIPSSGGSDKKPKENKNKAAVILNRNALGVENRILVFDEDGELLHDTVVNDDIDDIRFSESGNSLYLLTSLELKMIDITEGTISSVTDDIDKSSGQLLYADDEDVIIAGIEQVHIVKIK